MDQLEELQPRCVETVLGLLSEAWAGRSNFNLVPAMSH